MYFQWWSFCLRDSGRGCPFGTGEGQILPPLLSKLTLTGEPVKRWRRIAFRQRLPRPLNRQAPFPGKGLWVFRPLASNSLDPFGASIRFCRETVHAIGILPRNAGRHGFPQGSDYRYQDGGDSRHQCQPLQTDCNGSNGDAFVCRVSTDAGRAGLGQPVRVTNREWLSGLSRART